MDFILFKYTLTIIVCTFAHIFFFGSKINIIKFNRKRTAVVKSIYLHQIMQPFPRLRTAERRSRASRLIADAASSRFTHASGAPPGTSRCCDQTALPLLHRPSGWRVNLDDAAPAKVGSNASSMRAFMLIAEAAFLYMSVYIGTHALAAGRRCTGSCYTMTTRAVKRNEGTCLRVRAMRQPAPERAGPV